MPRGRQYRPGEDGPSDDELAEFTALLQDYETDSNPWSLASGSLGELIDTVTDRGYALRIAPTMRGEGRAVTLYVGKNYPQIISNDPGDFESKIRGLLLAAKKLPRYRG